MAESTGQEFQQLGERVLKRTAIAQEIGKGKDLSEIKGKVRANKSHHEQLIANLREQITTPDPQMYRLTEYFYGTVADKYPEVTAFGLAGSGALGGSLIRKEAGVQDFSDYDGYLVIKPQDKDPLLRERIQKEVEGKLKDLLDNNDPLVDGLPKGFHFCHVVNYNNLYLSDLSQMSNQEIELELLDIISRSDQIERAAALAYFMPTYPPEVGERNREKLLEFLKALPIDKWDNYSNLLTELWKRSMITVKAKHVVPDAVSNWDWSANVRKQVVDTPDGRGSASLIRDIKLAGKIESVSPLASYEVFKRLIDSTRPS